LTRRHAAGAETRIADELEGDNALLPRPGELCVFETGHSDEERGKLSAVHVVRFALSPAARRAIADAEVALAVDHPFERGRTILTPADRHRLAEDLA
jgi:hypothetical protein